ncbi:MAG: hypothetical protein PVG83_02680 [Acidimicrobiia bacterium]
MTSPTKPPHPQLVTRDLGPARVTITLDAGPRIVGYVLDEHRDLFADLPNVTIDHPSMGPFRMIGGHRLWRAPEIPRITYQPDDRPVAVEQRDDGLTVTGPPDADGIVKVISMTQHVSLTIVDHVLRNEGPRPVRTAPWAITQLTPGGTAILPHGDDGDDDGVLPDRSVTVWPYTDLKDPGVSYEPGQTRVFSDDASTKWKIGQPNRAGWLAYAADGAVFVKWAPLHDEHRVYPHLGASVEFYRDRRFVELESLSPVDELAPGGEMAHREVWTMIEYTGDTPDDVLHDLPSDPLEGESAIAS